MTDVSGDDANRIRAIMAEIARAFITGNVAALDPSSARRSGSPTSRAAIFGWSIYERHGGEWRLRVTTARRPPE
jgi:hypothetical protein